MLINILTQTPVGADLSALAGFHNTLLNLLIHIIYPLSGIISPRIHQRYLLQLMQTLQLQPTNTIFPLFNIKCVLKFKSCMVNDQRFAIIPVTSDATDANVTNTSYFFLVINSATANVSLDSCRAAITFSRSASVRFWLSLNLPSSREISISKPTMPCIIFCR